jgi:hypothetical protein
VRRVCVAVCGMLAAGCTEGVHPAPTTEFIAGYHFGTPSRISVALGAARVVRREVDSANASIHRDRDVFALVEPGWKAGRMSVGYGFLKGSRSDVALANARVTALKRWSGDSGRVYLGIEGSAGVLSDIALGLRAGLFTAIAGNRAGNSLLVSVDFPIGW